MIRKKKGQDDKEKKGIQKQEAPGREAARQSPDNTRTAPRRLALRQFPRPSLPNVSQRGEGLITARPQGTRSQIFGDTAWVGHPSQAGSNYIRQPPRGSAPGQGDAGTLQDSPLA